MATNKLKGLITEQDKRKFLREIYEASMVDQTQRQINSFSEEEFYGGVCPYCKNPSAVFLNLGKVKVGDRPFVRVRCDGAPPHITGCGKELYLKVKVIQKGDLLAGFKFFPELTFYTIEDIQGKYGKETVVDDEIREVHEIEEKKRLAEHKAKPVRNNAPVEIQPGPDKSRKFIGFRLKG